MQTRGYAAAAAVVVGIRNKNNMSSLPPPPPPMVGGHKIHGELADVYGSSALSYAQVKFWVGEFKLGRTSLEDEARSGRPSDATEEEMCNKVLDLVYSDRWIQVEETAQALGISHGSVSTILHDRLGMRKLTARWVPKSLSDEQMATRTSVCIALLKRFRSKDDYLLLWWLYLRLGFIIMSQRIKLSG